MARYVHSKSGSYDYAKELIRNVSGWVKSNKDYLETQVPYYGDYLHTVEDAKFWADYKKNTGFSPRYPRRAYGNSGTVAVSSTARLFRNVKKLYG